MNKRLYSPRAFAALLLFAASLAGFGPLSPLAPAQVADARAESGQAASYACPMHPEVVSKEPGACPKCGMRLIRVEKATAPAVGDAAPGAKASIPDTEVLDQDGRRLHFYTDLVKGRTVAINFIFTNCTTICPPLAATFARLQRDLGERVGRDVNLISVSVDPATDTPERLKAWGTKFKAGPGWTFVTGPKPQMDALLQALGAYSARREDHTPAVIIGNDGAGQWTRAYGLAKPSQLIQLIDAAREGRLESNAKEPTKQ